MALGNFSSVDNWRDEFLFNFIASTTVPSRLVCGTPHTVTIISPSRVVTGAHPGYSLIGMNGMMTGFLRNCHMSAVSHFEVSLQASLVAALPDVHTHFLDARNSCEP